MPLRSSVPDSLATVCGTWLPPARLNSASLNSLAALVIFVQSHLILFNCVNHDLAVSLSFVQDLVHNMLVAYFRINLH